MPWRRASLDLDSEACAFQFFVPAPASMHACMHVQRIRTPRRNIYLSPTRLLLLRTLRCHSKPHRAWVVQSSSDFAPSEIRLRRGAKVTPVRCSHESCQFAGAVKTPRIVDEQVACMRWPGGTAEAISDLERVNGGRCALKFLPIAPVGVLPVVVSRGEHQHLLQNSPVKE